MSFPKGQDIWNGKVKKIDRESGGFMECVLLETDNGEVFLEIEEMTTVFRQMLNANVILALDVMGISSMATDVSLRIDELEDHMLETLDSEIRIEQHKRKSEA
jgi:hypothetical protein